MNGTTTVCMVTRVTKRVVAPVLHFKKSAQNFFGINFQEAALLFAAGRGQREGRVGESAPSVSTANTKLGIPSYVCCWSGATRGSGEKECFPIVFANNMSALQLQMMESHQSGAR